MEKKLMEYRTKQRRQLFLNKTKRTLTNLIMWSSEKPVCDTKLNIYNYIETETEELNNDVPLNTNHSEIENEIIYNCSYLDYLLYILYFILWITLYMIFIKLEFGTVYLIVSAIICIYLNTRTRPKQEGEVSAYSVFNKNCESIDGTLKAEQFEKEIRFGSL